MKAFCKKNLRLVSHKNPYGLPDVCDGCGTTYRQFKTGFNYSDVIGMLWVGSDRPDDWRYKRRGTVLGLWNQLKKSMWRDHVDRCDGKPPSSDPWDQSDSGPIDY